jgi:predicted nucleic acid-binding protein
MGVLIDTSVLIASERGKISLATLLATRREEDCFISAITASELLHGVHRSSDMAVRTRRSVLVNLVLDSLPILPVDLSIARVHAQLWAELAQRGTPIGTHDLWLAASAVTHGLPIATLNVREFERVPGLKVEKWVL